MSHVVTRTNSTWHYAVLFLNADGISVGRSGDQEFENLDAAIDYAESVTMSVPGFSEYIIAESTITTRVWETRSEYRCDCETCVECYGVYVEDGMLYADTL